MLPEKSTQAINKSIRKELKRLLNEQRENNTFHLPVEQEFNFYRKVAHGDLQVLGYEFDATPGEGMGVLSKNSLRNARYHLIVLITMITRLCIENGLPVEEAYTLSDMFIQESDECKSIEELSEVKKTMVHEYTMKMHDIQTDNVKTLPVKRAMEYVDAHLTEPITPADVAASVHLSADYLSRLFIKEKSMTLGRYILEQKCSTACYMLENSSASCTEIATFLGFASSSYFIERFKSVHGITPLKYRATHARHEFK